MEKSAEAFRTISEVSDLLDTPAHVLRFWESRFTQVKPIKRAGGRRYYRPADLALLDGIRKLLKDEGLTIRGVQKVLREQGARHVAGLSAIGLGPADHEGEAGREPESAAPERVTIEGARPVQPAVRGPWPAAPAPGAADPGVTLIPDPDDEAPVPEAPIEVDAPILPMGDNVHRLMPESPRRPGFSAQDENDIGDAPEETAGDGASAQHDDAVDDGPVADEGPGADPDAPPPLPPGERTAAALLRAMDAARASESRSALLAVYLRLDALRERLAARAAGTSR